MTTKDYQQKGMFSIFLSFFKPHRGLFFLDMVCALFVALVDLAYPVISRKAINTLLPNLQYKTFFLVMRIVVRQGMSRDMADMLLGDIRNAVAEFEKLQYPTPSRIKYDNKDHQKVKVYTH